MSDELVLKFKFKLLAETVRTTLDQAVIDKDKIALIHVLLEDVERSMPETIGSRVRRLRLALGFETQQAWATYLGVGFNRWNHVEHDHQRLSRDLADRLCRKVPELSLDWLYFGDGRGMGFTTLMKKLDAAPSA